MPVVIIILLCGLYVSQGSAEEMVIIPPRILVPDYVDAGKPVIIKAAFDKSIYSAGNYYFSVIYPEGFNRGMNNFPISMETYEITATAPTQEGKYVIRFNVNDQEGASAWAGSSEVHLIYDRTPTALSFAGGIAMGIIMLPVRIVEAMGRSPSLLTW